MFFKIFKLFFSAKFSITKPPKKKIIIFDKTGKDVILKALGLSINDFCICENRKKEFNIFVLLQTMIGGDLSYKSYLINYIKLVDPVLVITFIDNQLFFYNLKEKFPKIKFVSIQNGVRFLNDEMLKTLHNVKNSKKKYKSDLYFVFSKHVKKIMEKYIDTKCIVVGSVKNNFKKQKKSLKKDHIAFISRFRGITLQAISTKLKDDPNFIVHEFSSKLLINLAKYCNNHNVKLSILTSTNSHLLRKEKEYYNDILNGYDFNFVKKKIGSDSYSSINKFSILISPSSTLGIEALSHKMKVIYFSEDKILGSNFGWPFLKKKNGPFFSNNYDYKNVDKIISNLRNIKESEWEKNLTKYKDYICNFDSQNVILRKIIKKVLQNY